METTFEAATIASGRILFDRIRPEPYSLEEARCWALTLPNSARLPTRDDFKALETIFRSREWVRRLPRSVYSWHYWTTSYDDPPRQDSIVCIRVLFPRLGFPTLEMRPIEYSDDIKMGVLTVRDLM